MHARRVRLFKCPRSRAVSSWKSKLSSLSPNCHMSQDSSSTLTLGGEAIRLTAYARCAGCAAKLGAADLTSALSAVPVLSDPRLIVGRETYDDAGVFVLSDDLALVQTVDFFAPIVDDPYLFGQIAATNALSDVYAMGGEPLTALNIVGFPAGKLPNQVLTDVLC